MSNLDPDQLAELKSRLAKEKEELEADLRSIARKNPDNPVDWEAKPDEGGEPDFREDMAERWETLEERSETTDALEVRLRNVESALGKMAQGTYGACEVGQEEIEIDRLTANPAARTCKKHIEEERLLS